MPGPRSFGAVAGNGGSDMGGSNAPAGSGSGSERSPARAGSEGVRLARPVGMRTYLLLSRIFPGSFRARLMALVLACTALPVPLLLGWLALSHQIAIREVLAAAAVWLLATAGGVLLAVLLVHYLLQPLRRAVAVLEDYDRRRALPQLPLHALPDDDMGRLLRGLERVLHGIDASRRQLERHALEDPLTEAMNRRGCGQALRASVASAAETGAPFVLCVVDLDNLKRINDDAGHAEGDYALVSLVRIARECCLGPGDWIGRWGGDEFMLGLHADPGVAMDRVRVWIDVLARPAVGARPVEVSVGAATWQPAQEAAQLYRQADAAMYQAKFAGGKRLVAHEDPHGATAAGGRDTAARVA